MELTIVHRIVAKYFKDNPDKFKDFKVKQHLDNLLRREITPESLSTVIFALALLAEINNIDLETPLNQINERYALEAANNHKHD
jgi:hypothetical protein